MGKSKMKNEDQSQVQEPETQASENQTPEVELNPMEQLEQELAIFKDKYMRLHADFDNYRKRTQKERIELIQNASKELITSLLPVVDDFDRAISANSSNDDIVVVKEGFTLIQQKMTNILNAKGLKPMNSIGEEFNTDLHEAITNVAVSDESEKGKVIDVVEKGYYLNDAVLRYAKVIVGL